MSSGIRILFALAGVIVVGGVFGLLVGYFHLPQTFEAAGIGVVIGVGIALGAFSLTPKKQSATGRAEFAHRSKLIAHSSKIEGSSPWHY